MLPLDLIRVIPRVLHANRATLIAKNLALRQRDRIFWVWLSKLWCGWRSALVVVEPATVVRWHRRGCRLYWRWKSNKNGQPKIDPVAESMVAKYMVRNRSSRTAVADLEIVTRESQDRPADRRRLSGRRQQAEICHALQWLPLSRLVGWQLTADTRN
jgi:hypothetical protein